MQDTNKALELQEKALQIRLKVLGDNHLDTASSFMNLAITVLFSLLISAKIIGWVSKGQRVPAISLGNKNQKFGVWEWGSSQHDAEFSLHDETFENV